jgi:hypothetical protein
MLTDRKQKHHCQVLTEEKFDNIKAQLDYSSHKPLTVLHKNGSVTTDCENCNKNIETTAFPNY